MEPLHPEFREALKRAHPGLTDETIDRVESLRARRFELDPSLHAERIAQLDREREELMAREIPHFAAIAQSFARREAVQSHQATPPPRVTIKIREP